MNAHGVVTLRIFSGPHLGAELVLPAGSYVIGSDDSCDIILHDTSLAARHARLLVTAPDNKPLPEAPPDNAPEEAAKDSTGDTADTALETTLDQREQGAFGWQTAGAQEKAEEALGVQVFALDGQATVDGVPLAEGQALLPQTPCFLGLTCLAWARYGQRATAWQEVLQRLHTPGLVAEESQTVEKGQQEPGEALSDAALSLAEGTNTKAMQAQAHLPSRMGQSPHPANIFGTLVLPETQHVYLRFRKRLRVLLLLLVLLGLCGLTISYTQRNTILTQYVDIIEQMLKNAGVEGLQVLRHERGVIIEGLLRNDKERGELVRLAQSVHFPVYLDVHVAADRLNAITAAFNSRQLYPLVQEVSGGQSGTLRISGYMKDGLIEQWGFSSVNEDVPELAKAGPEGVVRHIRHASDVAAVLMPALARAELGFVQVAYHPGFIELAGTFDTKQRKDLEATLDAVRAELGIPLTVRVHTALAESARTGGRAASGTHGANAGPTSGAGTGGVTTDKGAFRTNAPHSDETRVNSPDDINIVGVTMTPMRFVSLASGERVFEGGLLPGGYLLESISTRILKLRKDGRVFDYQLRGSDE